MEQQENKITEQEHGEATREPSKDRFLAISIIVAAIIIGGSVVFATMRGGSPNPAATGPIQNAPAPTAQAPLPPIGGRDVILGNPNAPVTLIEYGDYQCPFCGRVFTQVEPQLRTDYINTGKVKMVFRNFQFLGQESVAAGEAAECAEDQNKFWDYHDALYAAKIKDVSNGGSENDGFFSRAKFLKLAQQVGLNVPLFTACIDSNKYADQIQKDRDAANAIGVNSTPTSYVNGQEILGAQPYSAFQTVIEAALQKKS